MLALTLFIPKKNVSTRYSKSVNRYAENSALFYKSIQRLILLLLLFACSSTSSQAGLCYSGPIHRVLSSSHDIDKHVGDVLMCDLLGGSYNVEVRNDYSDYLWCTDGTTTAQQIREQSTSAPGLIYNQLWYQYNTSAAQFKSSQVEFYYTREKCEEGSKFILEPEPDCGACGCGSGGESGDESVGNPCSPITGNKSQTEVDLDLSKIGLTLSRHYQSQSLGDGYKNLGDNWRHSYTQHLGNYASSTSYDDYTGAKSQLYSLDSSACATGWNDIKATAFRGMLATTSQAFFRNDVCEIEQNNEVVTYLPIHDTVAFIINENSVSNKIISRPNGATIAYSGYGTWSPINPTEATLEELTNSWQFTDVDNTVELYDEDGFLQSTTTQDGWVTSFTYDASDRLDTVTGPFNHQLLFNYDAQDRVSTVTTPIGDITYAYDAANNLESVTYPDGRSKQYHYENITFPHHLTGITDANNVRYATWDYDASGYATLSEHAGGAERVELVYNPDGTTTVTDSRGSVRTYNNTISGGKLKVESLTGVPCLTCANGQMKERDYDADGNLIEFTDWQGFVTQYDNYDTKFQYATMREAVGTTEERQTDYTYDPDFLNKVITKTEPSVFTGNSKVTTTDYDDYGNPLSTIVSGFDALGDSVTRTTTRQYNGPLNQLSFVDGPRTDVNDYTYYRYYDNTAEEGVNRGRLKEIEDASGVLLQSNIQYSATGKVTNEDRPNDLFIDYSYYSGNDRLETSMQSGDSSQVTKYTYLASGEVETITTAFGSIDAATLTFAYDDARRLTRITNGLGHYIQYTLDSEGNRESEKTYDVSDTLKRQLTKTFDVYNKLDVSSQENENSNTNYASDGSLDQSTDGNSVVSDYSYDALRRLTQTIQNAGGVDTSTADATTIYEYDEADNLITVTDPSNGNTIYQYDDLGNMLSTDSPDTGITEYTYDEAGNIKTKTTASGTAEAITLNYSYDALNRLNSVVAPTASDNISYSYDACYNGSGKLCKIETDASSIVYAYDTFGNVINHQGVVYDYDKANRVKTLTYPSGAMLTYSYDVAGQLNEMDLTVNGFTEQLVGDINYAPFGGITSLNYGNAHALTQTYDTAYRMTSQSIVDVLTLDYTTYDNNGNLKQTDDNTETLSETSTYDYDPLNRLTLASGPFGTAWDYEYDKNGNRTQADEVSLVALAYEPNSNRLDTLGASDIILDVAGNTLFKGDWNYNYTSHHRLADATESSTLMANFAYNGLGQRVLKERPDTTGENFYYGQNGELLVETDINGNVLVEYIYLNGQLLAIYHPDSDSDGLTNKEEAVLGTNPTEPDDDNDGLSNSEELLLYGTSINSSDSDGDGQSDEKEILAGSDPLDVTSFTSNEVISVPTLKDAGLIALSLLLLAVALIAIKRGNHSLAVVFIGMGLLCMESSQKNGDGNMFLKNAHALPVNSGKLYFVHNDHLGTPQVMTDELGGVVWRAVYDPFGKAVVDGGSSVELNVRFPGQYYDVESGLHYNMFRTYDPELGRYLTSDPIGLLGGINTYAYVGGNPLIYYDSFGLKGKSRKLPLNEVADLLDTTACHWWPASCLTICVRWRCETKDKCGKVRYSFIGSGYPYAARPEYNPNNDADCVCVKKIINPN